MRASIRLPPRVHTHTVVLFSSLSSSFLFFHFKSIFLHYNWYTKLRKSNDMQYCVCHVEVYYLFCYGLIQWATMKTIMVFTTSQNKRARTHTHTHNHNQVQSYKANDIKLIRRVKWNRRSNTKSLTCEIHGKMKWTNSKTIHKRTR